ncbi:MAG: hypothetical protein ACT6FE_06965 [Methanosarcinaceae archaeon]
MTDTTKNHQIFDISYVWEVAKLIPLFAVAAYVIGYVVNQSYLASLGIPSVRFINSAFFKSGLLVLAVFFPVVYSVYVGFDDPTDNIQKAIIHVPIIVNQTISIVVILTYIVTLGAPDDFAVFMKQGPFPKALLPIMMLDLFLWFYATSYSGRRMSFRTRSLVLLLPAAAVYTCALLAGPPAARVLLKQLGYTSVITFIALGLYGDRRLTTAGPLVLVIGFLVACSVFGREVYPAIPTYFGGSRPYSAILTVKTEYATAISQMGFALTRSSQIEKATISYDDADTYVLTNDKGSHAISKQVFVAISSFK